MKKVTINESFESLFPPGDVGFGEDEKPSSFFFTLPWFRHLIDTSFATDAKLRLYCLQSESISAPSNKKRRVILPMCYRTQHKDIFSPRKLTAATNFYTSLFGSVEESRSGTTPEDVTLIAQAIANDSLHWDMVDFSPLDTESALFRHLPAALRQAGMVVQPYFCFGNWYLDINDRSYQAYFDGLPSRLKNTIQRKSRQLESNGRLRIEIISDETDVARGITSYEKVYQSSWKAPEPHPAFMPGLMRLCAKQGWLRLGIAYIDNQPAAAQLWVVHKGVASIYKLAYDERFSALSVGSILTARLMQHVIDVDRVHEVDYLTGDDLYKRDWMSHRRERWGVIAFNLRTLKGVLAAIRHVGGRTLKRWIKL